MSNQASLIKKTSTVYLASKGQSAAGLSASSKTQGKYIKADPVYSDYLKGIQHITKNQDVQTLEQLKSAFLRAREPIEAQIDRLSLNDESSENTAKISAQLATLRSLDSNYELDKPKLMETHSKIIDFKNSFKELLEKDLQKNGR